MTTPALSPMSLHTKLRAVNSEAWDFGLLLAEAGHETAIVGGAVRDVLLGKQPKDLDLATAASCGVVASIAGKHGYTVESRGTSEKHGIVVLRKFGFAGRPEGSSFEVATFRSDGKSSDGRAPDSVTFGVTLVQDLARRDFTVNAMALTFPREDSSGFGALVDPFGGQVDLKARVLRLVGDPEARLSEDHLRALRAMRFARTLGFSLAPETETACVRYLELAGDGEAGRTFGAVSAERIVSEVTRMEPELSPAVAVAKFVARFRGFEPRMARHFEASKSLTAEVTDALAVFLGIDDESLAELLAHQSRGAVAAFEVARGLPVGSVAKQLREHRAAAVQGNRFTSGQFDRDAMYRAMLSWGRHFVAKHPDRSGAVLRD